MTLFGMSIIQKGVNLDISTISRGVIRFNIKEPVSWFLLQSDVHADSIDCDMSKLQKDLKKARDLGATILINGDLFDAMQGRNDPRRSYKELKESLKSEDYYDGVLEDVWSTYKPYADLIGFVGYGNHEYSVQRHSGTDLVNRLVGKIRDPQVGGKAVAGGFGTWARFAYYAHKQDTPTDSVRMYANHGYGGTEAPVTKGVIQTNRQGTYLRNVDVVWNGHNHNGYIVPIQTIGLTNKDTLEESTIWYLRTPGYKNGYRNGIEGWETYSGMGPKPIGSIWMKLQWDSTNKVLRKEFAIDVE